MRPNVAVFALVEFPAAPGFLPGLLRAVIEPLAAAQEQARATRSREVAASRVEFFTMVREAA